MEKMSTLSTLISTFNEIKRQVRAENEKKLWERNKLLRPQSRDGYEIREEIINLSGKTIIHQQLWKKVDEIRTELSADIKVEEA